MADIEAHMEGGLAYWRYWSGPDQEWILMLPGAGAAGSIWYPQITFLRRSYNLLVVDLPGHGRSQHGPKGERYTFPRIAERVLAVLDREEIPRVHLLAMSLGGLVAETLALHHPARVQSLLLASGIARLNPLAASTLFLGWMLSGIMPYLLLYRLFAWLIMPGRRHASTRLAFAGQAARLGRGEFLRWFHMAPATLRLFRLFKARPARIPTLFLMGDHDFFFRRSALARGRVRVDTAVAVIPHSGHVCSFERPQEFNRILEDFLRRHPVLPESGRTLESSARDEARVEPHHAEDQGTARAEPDDPPAAV